MKEETKTDAKPTGLLLLREPFPDHQISKLPKPYKSDSQKGKCSECRGYHGLPAMHLDYVGHAALTDRLLDADPSWNWEYVAVGPDGNPVFDKDGGMWIRLTVCGVTRLGYGDAQGKTGGNATKERIGDALRNAAMRFGAALDLWHKGDLHLDAQDDGRAVDSQTLPDAVTQAPLVKLNDEQVANIEALASEVGVDAVKICEKAHVKTLSEIPMVAYQSIIAKLELARKK